MARALAHVTIVPMTPKKTPIKTARKAKVAPIVPPVVAPAPAPVKRKPKVKPQPATKKRATARKPAAKPIPKEKPKPLKGVRALKHAPVPSKVGEKPDELDAEEKAAKAGRTLWKPDYIAIAHNTCAIMGATDKELAGVLGVSVRTIDNWKHQHPEFRTALSTGKLIADTQVAAALYKTAVGYQHDDIDIRAITLPGMNAGSEVTITPIVKVVQPNPQSIQWWLKNRRPADWKDKSEVTVDHVNLDLETAQARFGDRMEAARAKQAEVRARRKDKGLTGD